MLRNWTRLATVRTKTEPRCSGLKLCRQHWISEQLRVLCSLCSKWIKVMNKVLRHVSSLQSSRNYQILVNYGIRKRVLSSGISTRVRKLAELCSLPASRCSLANLILRPWKLRWHVIPKSPLTFNRLNIVTAQKIELSITKSQRT
jgi:hypothetical protein